MLFCRLSEGETCCRQSRSLSCGMVCRSMYLASSNTRTPIRILSQHCGGVGSPVTDCMQRQAQTHRASNPSDSKYMDWCFHCMMVVWGGRG